MTLELRGVDRARARSDEIDELVVSVWKRYGSSLGATLIAVGGYGRRELCRGSDVDLLIEVPENLWDSSHLHEAVESFLKEVRESRLRLGHAVRTREMALQAFQEDPRTAIATLDARLLGGDEEAQEELVASACAHLRGDDHGRSVAAWLLHGHKERGARFGQTIYLLEPELKNGKGGLRDLQAIGWAARIRYDFDVLTEEHAEAGWTGLEEEGFRNARDWLLSLRYALHEHHQRKHDRLYFADQESLAKILYPQLELAEAVETMMRRHYQETRSVSALAERMLRRASAPEDATQSVQGKYRIYAGQVGLVDETMTLQPDDVFDILELAGQNELLLDPAIETAMFRVGEETDAETWLSAPLQSRLLDLITDVNGSPRNVMRLLDLGIFARMIPEFEPIVCHVQHDVYHVYTTDVHLVMCLEFCRAIFANPDEGAHSRWPLFTSIAEEVEDRQVLLLACLLHDIGKNRGGGHSQKGAAMMQSIGRLFGLSADRIDLLTFLVREHLILSHTSRRRDISDRRVIRDLAARIRTVEALNQLTVLTFCDMSTVGAVVNDWNATLLSELYRRLRTALEHGVESTWRALGLQVEEQRRYILSSMSDDQEVRGLHSALDEFLRDIPSSHVAATAPAGLARQFKAWEESKRTRSPVTAFHPQPERGSTEVIVAAQDVPGALASITGVLAASGLDILAALIVTTASGRTLDVFQVALPTLPNDPTSRALTDERRMQKVRDRMPGVLAGELDVEVLLEKRRSEQKLLPRPRPAVASSVEVLEGVSDEFTVIEVRAADRLGLLYDIARAFQSCEVNIYLSKVDSLGDQVIDTFYVEDLNGQPLDPTTSAEIAERVAAAIE